MKFVETWRFRETFGVECIYELFQRRINVSCTIFCIVRDVTRTTTTAFRKSRYKGKRIQLVLVIFMYSINDGISSIRIIRLFRKC